MSNLVQISELAPIKAGVIASNGQGVEKQSTSQSSDNIEMIAAFNG